MTSTLNLILERGMRELTPMIGENVTEDTLWDNSTTTTGEVLQEEGDDDAFYEASTVALILPRITAVISLFAVICVATEAWQDLRMAKSKTRISRGNRIRSKAAASNVSTITNIQLWYQLPLFCHALAFALGTTPAPQDLGIWGAVGNTATCEAQGFLLQFGIFGNMGWDIALSTAYLMMVRYLVADFRLQSWEKYYHIIIWPSVLAICIAPLVLDMYNFNHSMCWLESYPNDCIGDECIRGEGAAFWQTIASFAGVLHLVYSITVMLCMYCSIRGLENRRQQRFSKGFDATPSSASLDSHGTNQTQRRTSSDSTSASAAAAMTLDRHYSRAVGIQGMLYSSGMIITTLPTAIYIVLWNLTGLWSPAVGVFATSMTPLMGYVNFLIFMRNRKVEQCRTRYGRFLRQAHSWIWDYQLFCQCHCHCLPTHVGGGAEGGTASSSSPDQVITTDHHHDYHTDDLDRTGLGGSTMHTASSLPMIEEGDVESSDDFCSDFESDVGEELSGTCGAWEIALKKQEPNGADDTVPTTLPIRLTTEAELPTIKPVRLESEISDLVMSSDFEDTGSAVVSEYEVPDTAPTKFMHLTSQPERLESCCVLEKEDAPDLSVDLKQDEKTAEDVAPTQPRRLLPTNSQADLPPTKPERFESCVSLD